MATRNFSASAGSGTIPPWNNWTTSGSGSIYDTDRIYRHSDYKLSDDAMDTLEKLRNSKRLAAK